MLDIPNLIAALGGPTKLAAECGVQPSAVSNWGARGSIPGEHRLKVWRMATEAGVEWAPPGCEGLALVPRPSASSAEAAA